MIGHFGVDKIKKLISQKYYRPSLRREVKAYVKGCDVCLALKVVKHKPYGDLQFLLIPTHEWKNLSIDFIIGLPISTNWKSESYNFILVIVNQLTKIIHYEPIKVTINTPGLAKVILDMVIRYYGLLDLIVTDRDLFFIFKFWSLLCYFLNIK